MSSTGSRLWDREQFLQCVCIDMYNTLGSHHPLRLDGIIRLSAVLTSNVFTHTHKGPLFRPSLTASALGPSIVSLNTNKSPLHHHLYTPPPPPNSCSVTIKIPSSLHSTEGGGHRQQDCDDICRRSRTCSAPQGRYLVYVSGVRSTV